MCTVICIFLIFSLLLKPQRVVIVSMFTSSAVYHGFNPRSGRNKDYNICIWFFYAQNIAVRVMGGCLRPNIMWMNRATRLLMGCCFSVLANE